MLIVTTKRFKKQYVIGGAGVFDTVVNFFRKLFTSDAAKQLASVALSATKEVGKKAIDIGKTAGFDAGKKLTTKLLTGKPPVTQKTRDKLGQLINGFGIKSEAVAIQDLVRRLNSGGKKSFENLKKYLICKNELQKHYKN